MSKILLVNKSFQSLSKVSVIMLLSVVMIACGGTPDEKIGNGTTSGVDSGAGNETVGGILLSNNLITKASWSDRSSRLKVSGYALREDDEVKIYDSSIDGSRTFIRSVEVEDDGSWELSLRLSTTDKVPCSIYASSEGAYELSSVRNAPSDCGLVYLNSQTVLPPQGKIEKPASEIDVVIGSSVTFRGSATDPNGDANLQFIWDFGAYSFRKVGQSTTQVFNRVGKVSVKLLVRDSTKLYDPTPDTVIVNVVDNTINSAPNSRINSPGPNNIINLGDTLFFNGAGLDPDGDATVYLWNFGGSGVADSTKRTPGFITFNKVGIFPISFTVLDSRGLADPSPAVTVVTVKGEIVNSAPNGIIKTPSANQSIKVGESVTFSSIASDAEGGALSYRWNFGASGIASSTLPHPGSLRFSKVGTFVVSLQVTDNRNLADASPDKVTIVVAASGNPPNGTISSPATNVEVIKGKSLTFKATATDPDGDSNLTYYWDFGYIRKVGKNVTMMFDQAGTVSVKLLIKDSTGKYDPTPDELIVNVLDQVVNTAPTGSIRKPVSDQVINVGDSVNFLSSASDPDGDQLTYLWDFDASGISRNKSKNPGNRKFNKAGVFVVTLTVTDSKGLADATPDTIKVTVKSINRAPNGTIASPSNNISIKAGESVSFTGSSTDADGDAVTYLWDFGTGDISTSTKQSPGDIIFDKAGAYLVSLVVTDKHSLKDPTPARVTVNVSEVVVESAAPNGTIVSPASRSITIAKGDILELKANAYDADNDTNLEYTWSFGDYAPGESGKVVSLMFSELGQVNVKLNVRDSAGLFDLTPALLTVNVTELGVLFNLPPESIIRVPSTDRAIEAGETVFFSGQAIDAENNAPLNYFWNFDGAVPNSMMQNPGSVLFNNPGVYRVTLTGGDNLGLKDKTPAIRIITVNGGGTMPDSIINSPSNDLVINVGESVRFSGSGTDADQDTPFDYFWNFDGVAPNSLDASPGEITFTNAGVYNISLRVTDASGDKDPTPASVKVTVTNIDSQNEPPNSIIITPSMNLVIFEGDSLTFRGTGNDTDGDALSYLWNFGAAAPNTFENNPGDIQFTEAGVFNISLTVTDSFGLSDATPASVRVTVRARSSSVAPNGTITSPADNMRITEGDVVEFSGFGSDADGDTLSYLWNFDGAIPHIRGLNPGNVTFAEPGTYRVRFSVTDASGLTDPTPAVRIIVVDAANAPTSNVSPIGKIMSPLTDVVVFVGQSINFIGSGSDPDGDLPLSYRWNFDGIVPNSTAKSPGLVTFTQVGTYRVVLTVTDASGSSDGSPVERLIHVVGNATENLAPNAQIKSPASDQAIKVNDVVNFEGLGTDPDGDATLTYIWDFDGAIPVVIGANPGNVTFKKAGTYIVTLKVIDSQGSVDLTPAKVIIRVTDEVIVDTNGANWQIIVPSTDSLVFNVGDSYTFRGAAVGLNGELSSFSYWNFNGYAPNVVGNTVSKTFNRIGTLIVDYKVKDANGDWVGLFDSVTIIVQ